jgi:hypothetical protein
MFIENFKKFTVNEEGRALEKVAGPQSTRPVNPGGKLRMGKGGD